MSGKNLKQSVTIKAPPKQVYDALVDAKEHAKFTGAGAKLEKKVGGRFAHFDGDLSGYVLHLDPGKEIVLAWRSESWAKGAFSIARFALQPVKGGTRLVFEQFGIPEDDFLAIAQGWKDYYWGPLKEYLEG